MSAARQRANRRSGELAALCAGARLAAVVRGEEAVEPHAARLTSARANPIVAVRGTGAALRLIRRAYVSLVERCEARRRTGGLVPAPIRWRARSSEQVSSLWNMSDPTYPRRCEGERTTAPRSGDAGVLNLGDQLATLRYSPRRLARAASRHPMRGKRVSQKNVRLCHDSCMTALSDHKQVTVCQKPLFAGILSAPKWTRTTTGKTPHKALNLARLPIPPRAQSRRV